MTPGAVLTEERFELGDLFGTDVLFDMPRAAGGGKKNEQ
jgi:hypothetical protein